MAERSLLPVKRVLALPNPKWLAHYILPERSLSMLWGPSNVGKSFLALDLACSIVAGNAWLGRNTEQGPVIYVASEGINSFKRRLDAWMFFNTTHIDDLDDLHFVNWPVQLHEGVERFLRLARPIDPVLVIFDTLAASTLGVSEDKTESIGPVMKSLLTLRTELKTAVMVIHHTGWQHEHERGSSAWRGAMDTSIEIRGSGRNRVTLHCAKQRDAEAFRPIRVRLNEVEWESAAGWPQKSLVPNAF